MKREDYIILGIVFRFYDCINEHKETVKRYGDDVIEAVSVPYLVSILEEIKDELVRGDTE